MIRGFGLVALLVAGVGVWAENQERVRLLGDNDSFVMVDLKTGQCEAQVQDTETGFEPKLKLTSTKSVMSLDVLDGRYLSSWTHGDVDHHHIMAIKVYEGEKGRKVLSVMSNLSYYESEVKALEYKKTEFEIVIDPRGRVESFKERQSREFRSPPSMALIEVEKKSRQDFDFQSVYQPASFVDGRFQFTRQTAIGVVISLSCAL